MNDTRNRLVAPRKVVNTKMLYSFYILKELAEGKTVFGNKILETFKDKFTHADQPFPVSSSSVYETLYTLETKGYVTSTWDSEILNKRNKKMYRITDEGIAYYKTHIADYVDNLRKTKSTLDIMIGMLI